MSPTSNWSRPSARRRRREHVAEGQRPADEQDLGRVLRRPGAGPVRQGPGLGPACRGGTGQGAGFLPPPGPLAQRPPGEDDRPGYRRAQRDDHAGVQFVPGPDRRPAGDRGRRSRRPENTATARARSRCMPARPTCTWSWSGGWRSCTGARRRSSSPPAMPPTSGRSRRCFATGDVVDQRPVQPRLDLRRLPAVGGQDAHLRPPQHAPPGARAEGRHAATTTARWSSPTACSPWKATWPRWTRSWPWPASTAPGSCWTTPTPWASSAPTAGARPSCTALEGKIDMTMGTLSKCLGGIGGVRGRQRGDGGLPAVLRAVVLLLRLGADPGRGRGPGGPGHHGDEPATARGPLAERPLHDRGPRGHGLRHRQHRSRRSSR